MKPKSAPFNPGANPAANPPEPPAHLDPPGADLWRTLTAEYQITDSGGLAFVTLACEALCRARRAQGLISEHGELVDDRLGGLKLNPAVNVERDSWRAMLAALRALNLDVDPARPLPGRPPNAGAKAW